MVVGVVGTGASVCVRVMLFSLLRMPGEMAVTRLFDDRKWAASAGKPWFTV